MSTSKIIITVITGIYGSITICQTHIRYFAYIISVNFYTNTSN